MNLVNTPLGGTPEAPTDPRHPSSRPDRSAVLAGRSAVLTGTAEVPLSPAVTAMAISQHAFAIVLTVVGVLRSITDGLPIATAIITGLAILAWHTAGTIIPARTSSRRVVTGWLIGFGVIWAAAVAVSAEFVWVAFLLWLLAGHLFPLLGGVVFSAVVLAVVVIAPVLHHGATSYASVIGPTIGAVFAFGISRGYLQLLKDAAERERLVASLTRSQRDMATLQDELALVQRESGAVAERTRISRDIHDTIAQSLSSIRLLAHAGGGRTEDPDAAQLFQQVETLAGESLADVRRIVAALVPAELDDNVLAAALQRMLDRTHIETGIQTELHVDDGVRSLPTGVEVALLRTAQSALANVRLHAEASHVEVNLVDSEGAVRLEVIDDGIGFDVPAWEQAEPVSDSASFGLRFMQSRLRELGGWLEISSTPGTGTALTVHVPLRPAAIDTTATNDAIAEEPQGEHT